MAWVGTPPDRWRSRTQRDLTAVTETSSWHQSALAGRWMLHSNSNNYPHPTPTPTPTTRQLLSLIPFNLDYILLPHNLSLLFTPTDARR